jgi:hypothetical protein
MEIEEEKTEKNIVFEEIEISLCEYLMQHIPSRDVESLARLLGIVFHTYFMSFCGMYMYR